MPLFWDFLLTPWRILWLFMHEGAQALPPPSPGLCSTQTVGDQALRVCHAFGYTMPSFIFWASLLIFALFAISSASLWAQCNALADSLARASRELRKIPSSSGRATTYETDLRAIGAVLSREESIESFWSRFEETLLRSPLDQEIYATQPIEQAFGKAQLLEQNVHNSFYSAVPGILTGVGLLMTFVAILDGLSHVTVAANMDVQGIGGLINGLSGKFVSSVTAVTCAVAFVFVERVAYSKPEQAYRSLVRELGSRFRRKTAEHLLHEIQVELAAARTGDRAPPRVRQG